MGSSQEKTSLLFIEIVILFVFSLSDQEEPRDTEDFPHQHLIMLGELVGATLLINIYWIFFRLKLTQNGIISMETALGKNQCNIE